MSKDRTRLHFAAMNGHMCATTTLLNANANENDADNAGVPHYTMRPRMDVLK